MASFTFSSLLLPILLLSFSLMITDIAGARNAPKVHGTKKLELPPLPAVPVLTPLLPPLPEVNVPVPGVPVPELPIPPVPEVPLPQLPNLPSLPVPIPATTTP